MAQTPSKEAAQGPTHTPFPWLFPPDARLPEGRPDPPLPSHFLPPRVVPPLGHRPQQCWAHTGLGGLLRARHMPALYL